MKTRLVHRKVVLKLVTDPVVSANEAGLIYSTDTSPGYTRKPAGKTFRYLDEKGGVIRDPETLRRIKSLVIPPAWRDVWICRSAQGHLQATGRDQRGRKQYRYHPRWRAVRDETKYERLIAFGLALPGIRHAVTRDMARPGLPRSKVLATVVKLLETTLIRVGNDEYARTNGSFGLTTMHDRHIAIDGPTLRFGFKGKSGKRHEIKLTDRRLAKIVKACRDLPGQELFQYLDDEERVQDVSSADINDYLRQVTRSEFTAKDFRTWAGTVLAAMALQEFEAFDSQAQAKRNILRAIEHVAERLGNTPAICRKCYIHPEVLNAYLDGTLVATLRQRAAQEMKTPAHDLDPEEAAVLALLQRRLADEQKALHHALTNGNGRKARRSAMRCQ